MSHGIAGVSPNAKITIAPEPKFYTKRGWLTPYALACGYVEQRTIGTVRVTLWEEHGCYHVRAHDDDDAQGRLFWETFDTLTEARKRYRAALRGD